MDNVTRFDSIVEKKIREALEQGKLDNLPGHGKPLNLEDDGHVPDDLKLAHKILKNAGCVPKELEINIEILLQNSICCFGCIAQGQIGRFGDT